MKPTYWSENLLEMAFESSDDSNTSVIGAPNTFFSYRKWMASLTESPVFSSRTCEKEIQISTRVSNESNRKGTTRNYTQRNRVGTREWILKAGNGAAWDVIKKDLEGNARVELVGGFRDEGLFLLSNTTSCVLYHRRWYPCDKWMASLTESPVFSSRTCEKEIRISTRVSNESNRKGTPRNYTQRNRIGTREWILKAGNGADWDVIKKDLEGSARVELVGGFRDEASFFSAIPPPVSFITSSTCPKSIFFFSYRVAFPCSYLPFFLYFPLLSSPCASSFMQQPSVKLLEFCHCPSWYYFPHDPPRAVKTMSSVGTEISILRKYDVLIKLLELRNKKNKTRGKVSWCRSRSQFEPENESVTGGVPDILYSLEISLDS